MKINATKMVTPIEETLEQNLKVKNVATDPKHIHL